MPCRHLATDASTNLQTPGALDSFARVLSDGSLENVRVREYALILIGNCGANSKGAALTLVKHQALAQGLLLCLKDGRGRETVRLREVTIIALKNCAAGSEEAAFIIASNSTTLVLLKYLAAQDVSARCRDVVSYLHLPARPARPMSFLRLCRLVRIVLSVPLLVYPLVCSCMRCSGYHVRHAPVCDSCATRLEKAPCLECNAGLATPCLGCQALGGDKQHLSSLGARGPCAC